MEEKYLPIGTIVKLKDVPTKGMIISYLVFSEKDAGGKVFDYGACPYPVGMVEANKIGAFNHEDIEEVLHMGYIDDDEKDMVKLLVSKEEEIKNSIKDRVSTNQESEN